MKFNFPFHFFWLIFVMINLVVQIAYFYNDTNAKLFSVKKITTPLLLFFGLFIVVNDAGGFPFIPCAILAAMGIGELGIEGSSVVEADENDKEEKKYETLIVTAAGVIFLLVNICIGGVLLFRSGNICVVLSALAISALFFVVVLYIYVRIFKPGDETRFQIYIYSTSLVVLLAGALAGYYSGGSLLSRAAAILTVSDFLVLMRMGARWKKNTPSGFRILLTFLVTILILYYVYIGTLIHLGSPFPQ